MGENDANENSLLKIKSIIKGWLERKDPKLIVSPLILNHLSQDAELNGSFQSLSYDGRQIKEVVSCEKCRALLSTKGNFKYNLKRHLNLHKNPKPPTSFHPSNIPNFPSVMVNANISIDSGVHSIESSEMSDSAPQLCTGAASRISNNSDENDVWFDALESL